MNLVRVPQGNIVRIHRPACRYAKAKSAVRWKWAEGKTLEQVFANWWNVPCAVCRPDVVVK